MMQEAYWHHFHNGLTYSLAFWTCLYTMLDARPTAITPLDHVNRDKPNHNLDTETAPSSTKINLASGILKVVL